MSIREKRITKKPKTKVLRTRGSWRRREEGRGGKKKNKKGIKVKVRERERENVINLFDIVIQILISFIKSLLEYKKTNKTHFIFVFLSP